MALTNDVREKLDDAHAQIARLRDQVEALMKDRVTPAFADFAGRAESAVHNARGVMKDQADAMSGRVKDQPFIAIVVAVAAGWVMGRMMR